MLSGASWDSFWLQPVRWQVGMCGLGVVWEMGRETLSLHKQLESHRQEAEPASDCFGCSHLKSGGGGTLGTVSFRHLGVTAAWWRWGPG